MISIGIARKWALLLSRDSKYGDLEEPQEDSQSVHDKSPPWCPIVGSYDRPGLRLPEADENSRDLREACADDIEFGVGLLSHEMRVNVSQVNLPGDLGKSCWRRIPAGRLGDIQNFIQTFETDPRVVRYQKLTKIGTRSKI